MCRGLLHGHVCGVWGLKSRDNGKYGRFSASLAKRDLRRKTIYPLMG